MVGRDVGRRYSGRGVEKSEWLQFKVVPCGGDG